MNNAKLIEDYLNEDEKVDIKPLLRERVTKLTSIIEALSALNQSHYWHVLKEHEFDGDLNSLVGRLEKEKDTVEIFRLQGEIKRVKKYDLEKLLDTRRKELEIIKQKI